MSKLPYLPLAGTVEGGLFPVRHLVRGGLGAAGWERMSLGQALFCASLFRTCCNVDTAEEEGMKSVDISIGNDLIVLISIWRRSTIWTSAQALVLRENAKNRGL